MYEINRKIKYCSCTLYIFSILIVGIIIIVLKYHIYM